MKAWWKTVDEEMLTAIDDGLLRNYDRILELKGGNFYDESRVAKSKNAVKNVSIFPCFIFPYFSNEKTNFISCFLNPPLSYNILKSHFKRSLLRHSKHPRPANASDIMLAGVYMSIKP